MINIFFLGVYAFLGGNMSAQTLYIIFSVHCILLLIPYFGQKKIIVTPISAYLLGVIIVNIANYVLVGNVGTERNVTYNYIIPQYINLATQIWCISTTFIYIGFQLAVHKSFAPIDFTIKKDKVIHNLFYGLLVVNVLQMAGFGIFNIGPAVKLVLVADLIGILFFARLWTKNNDGAYRVFALTLWFIQTYIALYHAFLRINLILPTVVLFIGYFVGKEDVKYIFSFRIVPFLIIFSLYASVFKTLGAIRTNFIYAFVPQSKLYQRDNQSVEIENKNALLDRSANLAQLTCCVNLTKKNGFYNGAVSAPLVLSLVPRFLWPNKPKVALGRWFALEIGVAYKNDEGEVNNSINMTVPGQLYLDFGWIGVVLGSMLVGAYFSVLWNASKFYSSEYNVLGILFGGNLLIMAFIGFGVDLQVVITVGSVYLMFLALKKVLTVI